MRGVRLLGSLRSRNQHRNFCIHNYQGESTDTGIMGAVQFDDFKGARRDRKNRWPKMLQERFIFGDSFCD